MDTKRKLSAALLNQEDMNVKNRVAQFSSVSIHAWVPARRVTKVVSMLTAKSPVSAYSCANTAVQSLVPGIVHLAPENARIVVFIADAL